MIGELVDVRGVPLAKATFASQAVATTGLAQMARELSDPNVAPFGPGLPIAPILPDGQEPRIWDYPVGFNIPMAPRTYEPITFAMLRQLADSYDVARLAIEKRKDGIRRLRWSIRPKALPNQSRQEAKTRASRLEDAVGQVTGFLSTPDQERQWGAWLARVLEDLFVIDAPTIWLRPNRGGELYGLEAIDGATIAPKIDAYGRIPLPPEPAYVQVIKGSNREFLTSDELVYAPYWQRTRSPYGSPPLSWVLLAVNRALRRQTLDLSRFTEGTLPVAFLKVAENMPAAQIKELKTYLDELLAGNDVARARVIPIPGGTGTGLESIHPEPTTEGEEWLLHLTCAALGVSPTELGFVARGSGLGGKGFAEVQQAAGIARDIGIAEHLKGQLDRIIARDAPSGLGQPELEFYWGDLEQKEDRLAEAQALKEYWAMGATTADWIAENVLDQDPPGLGAVIAFGGLVQTVEDFLNPPAPPAAPLPSGVAPGPGGPPPETPSNAPGEDTTQGGPTPVAKASATDLARWERKALRAVKDGRDPARFESAAIEPSQIALLRDALAKASSVEDVRGAFDLVKAGGSDRPLPEPSSAASSGPSTPPGSSARDDRWWTTWR